MLDDFNDDLTDLIGGAPRAMVAPPESFKPAIERLFTEACPKCRGSGVWRPGYRCFACAGTGKLTFKTPADHRAHARTLNRARQVRKATNNVESFKAAHGDVYAWMIEAAPSFGFAASMVEALRKYGDLTEGQIAACRKCMAAKERAKAERVTRESNAQAVNVSALESAFAKASASLRRPKLRIAHAESSMAFEVTHAAATGKNPGALYVKDGADYLGKIVGGKFVAVRSCGAERESAFIAAASNPESATVAYGRLTGACGCCGRELTNGELIGRGIGPVCAAKYGW